MNLIDSFPILNRMPTTTDQFQVKPDFFATAEECKASEYKSVNTNPRYKHFTQTHFTAGDTEQFQRYKTIENETIKDNVKSRKFPLPNPLTIFNKYKNLTPAAVDNTFSYLFHKFKKGIFVKMSNGELAVFLPFSKKNYTNEWAKRIKIDPVYGDMNDFFRLVTETEGHKFNPSNVHKFIEGWYANNCLLRYEFPISESDTNIPIVSDMLRVLAKERDVPDVEFFVNRRDFPLLRVDGTEPYHHIFGQGVKLLSHSYSSYCPILSMVSCDRFADIAIPTGEDWARVVRKEGKFFARTSQRCYEVVYIPWVERKPIAVFRGSSTGVGVTIETNQRLKIASLSPSVDSDGLPLLDAGITEWNLRPRKIMGEKYLKTIDIKSLPFGLASKLSPQEQCQYKYVVNVPGHVAAYRLSLELEAGFCVLLVECPYRLWYSHLLKPFIHYVPVKADLSDLLEKIKWCKQNDKEAEKIAKNARAFALKYLNKEAILDYLQTLMTALKKITGQNCIYNSIDYHSILKEKEQISFVYPKTKKDKPCSLPNFYPRCFSYLQGIQWTLQTLFDKGTLQSYLVEPVELFNNMNTVITRYKFLGFAITEKRSKTECLLHESFVATEALNSLSKYIPNFAYTFGLFKDCILTEHIEGETLLDYIRSTHSSIQEFFFILLQVFLALQVSQRYYSFVHYDLAPWNIILKKTEKPQKIEYIVSPTQVYRVTTSLIPVIIDFSHSHIVHENFHYGQINPFFSSTIQDVVNLLVTSVYEITERKDIMPGMVETIVKLSNFLAKTKYRSRPFQVTGKNGVGDLRYFFGQAKKYDEMINSPKHELEKKTPLDIVEYILGFYPMKGVEKGNSLTYHGVGNSRQVFEYIFSETKEEKLQSFLSSISRVKVPKVDNIALAHYISINVMDSLTSTFRFLEMFTSDYSKKYEKILQRIENEIKECIEGAKEDEKDMILQPLTFDSNIFYQPEKILPILSKYSIPHICISQEIEDYLTLRSLPFYSVKSGYTSRDYNTLANYCTLYELSRKIYAKNLEKFPRDHPNREVYEKIVAL